MTPLGRAYARDVALDRVVTPETADRIAESAKTAFYAQHHSPSGSRTNGVNWIEASGPGNTGQMPAYIQNVHKGILRGGADPKRAWAIAVGKVQDWAAGKGNVSPEVRAAAQKAVAELNAMRATNAVREAFDERLHPRDPHGRFTEKLDGLKRGEATHFMGVDLAVSGGTSERNPPKYHVGGVRGGETFESKVEAAKAAARRSAQSTASDSIGGAKSFPTPEAARLDAQVVHVAQVMLAARKKSLEPFSDDVIAKAKKLGGPGTPVEGGSHLTAVDKRMISHAINTKTLYPQVVTSGRKRAFVHQLADGTYVAAVLHPKSGDGYGSHQNVTLHVVPQKKPSKPRIAESFDEQLHPRDADGKFAKKLNALQKAHPNVDLRVSQDAHHGHLSLSMIRVPSKEHRGKGHASAALKDLHKLADEHGVPVRLTPDAVPQEGTGRGLSKTQLTQWYKSQGYVNKPKSDFASRDTMIRRPQNDPRLKRFASEESVMRDVHRLSTGAGMSVRNHDGKTVATVTRSSDGWELKPIGGEAKLHKTYNEINYALQTAMRGTQQKPDGQAPGRVGQQHTSVAELKRIAAEINAEPEIAKKVSGAAGGTNYGQSRTVAGVKIENVGAPDYYRLTMPDGTVKTARTPRGAGRVAAGLPEATPRQQRLNKGLSEAVGVAIVEALSGAGKSTTVRVGPQPAGPRSPSSDFERKHPRGQGGRWATVASGAQGSQVKAVQRKIGAKVDGVFGTQTAARVRAFQKAHGLQVDGIVGRQTAAAMRGVKNAKTVRPGALTQRDRSWLSGRRPASSQARRFDG